MKGYFIRWHKERALGDRKVTTCWHRSRNSPTQATVDNRKHPLKYLIYLLFAVDFKKRYDISPIKKDLNHWKIINLASDHLALFQYQESDFIVFCFCRSTLQDAMMYRGNTRKITCLVQYPIVFESNQHKTFWKWNFNCIQMRLRQ